MMAMTAAHTGWGADRPGHLGPAAEVLHTAEWAAGRGWREARQRRGRLRKSVSGRGRRRDMFALGKQGPWDRGEGLGQRPVPSGQDAGGDRPPLAQAQRLSPLSGLLLVLGRN